MSLRGRLARLEDRTGGKDCPRCSGVVVVSVNGDLHHASKNGEPMSEEEYHSFEAEDIDGRCPVCGEESIEIIAPAPHGEGGL